MNLGSNSVFFNKESIMIKSFNTAKKVLIPVLLLLLVFSLTACQSSANPSPSVEANANGANDTVENTAEAVSEGDSKPAASESADNSDAEGTETASDTSEAPEPYYFDDFELTALNGDLKSLYDYEGQLIILNFWATWCTYCEQEMPLLNEVHQRDGIKVVAIDVGEDAKTVQDYIDLYGYDLDFYLDENSALASMFGVSAFPTSIFIGPDFEYYYSYPGMLTDDYLSQLLDAIETYPSTKNDVQ
jgi:thiol-disulfide isomerase/thioredoxin